MLCLRFLHIVAMLFVWICLLHFLDIIIYVGRVYTLFVARMRDLRPSVSWCTLINCVTINMIYRPSLLQDIYILSQICFVFQIILLPCLYIDSGYTAILSCTIVCPPPILLHPLTLSYWHDSMLMLSFNINYIMFMFVCVTLLVIFWLIFHFIHIFHK